MGFADKLKKAYFSVRGTINYLTGKVAPTLYMEEIEDHFTELFNVKDEEHRVFHELMSEYVHIDIHIISPNEERPFYVLFTTGMSDLQMTMPEEATWDEKKLHERAEIICFLPPNWQPENPESPDDDYSWVISCLKRCARYPHEYKTYLEGCHTIQFTMENKPFSDNTRFSSVVFIGLDYKDFDGKYGDKFGGFSTKDNTYINLICLIPIYEEEMNFKLEEGAGKLFMRLFGETVKDFQQLVINNKRESVA